MTTGTLLPLVGSAPPPQAGARGGAGPSSAFDTALASAESRVGAEGASDRTTAARDRRAAESRATTRAKDGRPARGKEHDAGSQGRVDEARSPRDPKAAGSSRRDERAPDAPEGSDGVDEDQKRAEPAPVPPDVPAQVVPEQGWLFSDAPAQMPATSSPPDESIDAGRTNDSGLAAVTDPVEPAPAAGRNGNAALDFTPDEAPLRAGKAPERADALVARRDPALPLVDESEQAASAAPAAATSESPTVSPPKSTADTSEPIRTGVRAEAAAALSVAVAAANRGAAQPAEAADQPAAAEPRNADAAPKPADSRPVAAQPSNERQVAAAAAPAPDVHDRIDLERSSAHAEQTTSPAALRIAHPGQGSTGGGDRGQDQRPGSFAAPHVFWPVAGGPSSDPVAADTFARLTGGSGLPMPSEAELSTVGPQLIRTLHMQVRDGGGQVRLTLSPEHLGTVTVDLRVTGSQVTAVLGAETAAVRGWLTAHEQDLRTGLSELGLTLEELVIRDEDTPRERQQAREHERPRPPKRRSATEPAFEIRV